MPTFVPDKPSTSSGPAPGFVPDRPAKPKRRGGVLGALSRIPGAFATDIYNAAVGTPAGLYYAGKAIVEPAYQDIRHGPRSRQAKEARARLNAAAKAVATSTIEDFRHPLRHPGDTALDVLGLASLGAGTAARAGAVSKAVRAGEEGSTVARAAKALATRPKPGTRALRANGLTVEVPAARSALGRAGQRGLDKTIERGVRKNPAGARARYQQRRVGKALAEQTRTAERIHNAQAAALQAAGRKLTPEEQYALRVVAEEAPLGERIAAQRKRVAQAKSGLERKRHRRRLLLLKGARKYLVSAEGRPAFKPGSKLADVYERMHQLVGSDEQLAKDLGLLTDEIVAGRKTAAGRVALGATFEDGAFVGAEHFRPTGQATFVPDIEQRAGRSGRIGQLGAQGTVGQPRSPIPHGFTGANKRAAAEPLDTTRTVAERSLALGRYARLRSLRGQLVQAATDVPQHADDVAIRLDNLGSGPLPKQARRFVDNPDELALLPEEAQASAFERVRKRLVFGDANDIRAMSPDDAAEFRRLAEKGLVGWVPRRLLGDLAKPHAPLQATIGRTPTAVWDSINDASKLAALYLKPAYAAPNILGNMFLTLVQQGFAAPRNIARACRLQWRLGADATARIDSIMGEGFAAALRGHSTGPLSDATALAANVWSKGVDLPFRRASFLYEARHEGFKSAAQLRRLLDSPQLRPTLERVSQRANRALIDYGRLSSRERELVRRIIYFYPWVKGSTLYAGHLLVNHPGQAAALGTLGAYGQQRASEELGPHPSYLAGAFPTRFGLVNPAAAAILQTPAQVGQAVAGLGGRSSGDVGDIANFITPALALALNYAARRNTFSGREYGRAGFGTVAADTLLGGLPQKRLLDVLRGTSQARLFPPDPRSALLQYLFGGIAPRPYDKARMRELAERETANR